jgi:hypothetical protein
LLSGRPANAVRHRSIDRCAIKCYSTVLYRKSDCLDGICRGCLNERLSQKSKAFAFLGDFAISGDFDGASRIISFECSFDQAFF